MALNRSRKHSRAKTVLRECDNVQVNLNLLVLLCLICATVGHSPVLSKCAVTLLHKNVSGAARVIL